MAFNPAAASVTSRSSTSFHSDPSPHVGSSTIIGGSQFRRGLPGDFEASANTMRPQLDTLYRIEVAGHRPKVDSGFERNHLETRSSNNIYADYWEPSIAVFPLATFEAQLYMQMLPEVGNVHVTHYQGNEAYSATKGVIEDTLVVNNEEENLLEENEIGSGINLLA